MRGGSAERVFSAVRDVQETVAVLLLLVDRGHQRRGRWQDVVDENENGLLRAKLDALADHVHELAHGQVRGHQVLLLVDVGDVAAVVLLADDRDSVRVLCPDALRLGLALG